MTDESSLDLRWFRFNLRGLFAAIAVFCIPLAWISWQLSIVRHRNAVLSELETSLWASAAFDDRTWDHVSKGRAVLIRPRDENYRIGRFRIWLGDRKVNELLLPDGIPPDQIGLLEAFPEAAIFGKQAAQ